MPTATSLLEREPIRVVFDGLMPFGGDDPEPPDGVENPSLGYQMAGDLLESYTDRR